MIDPSVAGRLMCCRGIETDRERVCGRGEESRAERFWVTTAAVKDAHNVLVAIYSPA